MDEPTQLKGHKMSRKKKIGFTCVILVIGLVVSTGIILALANRDTTSPLETRNPSGTTGYMLIVYRPGISSFPADVMNKFAEGAISTGWKLDISTVSEISPKDISKYDLIVILSPVYMGAPQAEIATYLSSVDLLQKPVVSILACGSNTGLPAMNKLVAQISAANGTNLVQAAFNINGNRDQVLVEANQLVQIKR